MTWLRHLPGSGLPAGIRRSAVLVAVLAVALAACGEQPAGTDGPAFGGGGPAAGQPAPSGVLTVPEALDWEAPGEIAVRGAVLARAGRVQLCEALAQSYPPQCGGRFLLLNGFDPATVEDAHEEQGVRWSDREIELIGRRSGDRFVVTRRSR